MNASPPTPTPTLPDPRPIRIRRVVERVKMRLRMREAVSLAPIAACAGLVAALVLVIAGRFRPLLGWPGLLAVGAGLVVAALLVATAYALLRPRDLMATARRADRILSLDERLSTALE